ncbi:MAG: hypothetical protein JKY93_12335, partial [Gammaproteobacteria bacterium]|nr:hypothetical protein [Gammaproteobacteria bacterium]
TVPNNANKLCYVQTESPYGPWDQVVYYRKDAAGALLLLGADKGSGVATFGGVSFSADGQYLWTDWAEEGHSSLYFYQTKAFLEVGLQQSVGAVHDYELDHVDGTLADGTLIYGLRKKTPNCADTTKYTVVTDQDACHQVVGLGVVVE